MNFAPESGRAVDWGHPPGAETATEAKAAKKIERLQSYAAEHGGSLEDPAGPQRLDVRSSSSLTVTPRPAIQTLSEPRRPSNEAANASTIQWPESSSRFSEHSGRGFGPELGDHVARGRFDRLLPAGGAEPL